MHNILVLFIFLLPIADSSFGVDCDQNTIQHASLEGDSDSLF
jgi:hypothetical protein